MSASSDNPSSPEVVFESAAWLAVSKPCGLQTEPDRYGHPDLCHWALDYLSVSTKSQLIYPVNRVDRPASGLVLMAKKKAALTRLQQQWDSGSVRKTYLAMVEGLPDKSEDTLRHYLVKDPAKFRAWIYTGDKQPQARACSLTYECLGRFGDWSLLKVILETGRYHQIRAQMSFIGHPLRNDALYGARQESTESVIGLHAWKLEVSMVEDRMSLTADPNINPFFAECNLNDFQVAG